MNRISIKRSLAGVGTAAAALVVLGTAAPTAAQSAETAEINFRTPFECNQEWNANTRANHNPQNSVDFQRADADGQPVLASADGTVSRVEDLGGESYGKFIVIEHADGWTTWYAHLSAQDVQEGDAVKTGDPIGKVGNTGGSTGPHLHYEQRSGSSVERVVLNGVAIKYYGDTPITSSTGC
ncbi:peptidase M23-like protein [Tamaricihabitans halophyticus]|uniref:Peptidase M23-like protein n=1 Tax=Tamaricihabitans halophyticus TaxID=1262583 RepID=A0A4V2SSX6_9PSEU|nr:M23 family metallopeptidase [Tamaricihabitans halophyticus]TCP48446.1 peptidase M23-like protein [Tamaricihabitans halophyticus]